jgi:hypothetical protein
VGERSGLPDAHRDDGKRLVVRADKILTAFLELEGMVHEPKPEYSSANVVVASGIFELR